MSFCWFCHYGWPQQVMDIYRRHLPMAGESAMHFGPAHIVWEDENFEREHIQSCLDKFDEWSNGAEHHSQSELAAVKSSLEELLALPDDVLYPSAAMACEEGDGDPSDYPPDPSLVMSFGDPR